MLERHIESWVGGEADLEMAQFRADLLQSVREVKAGTFAHSTTVPVTDALQPRAKLDLSQSQFAKLFGVSVPTPQALLGLAN